MQAVATSPYVREIALCYDPSPISKESLDIIYGMGSQDRYNLGEHMMHCVLFRQSFLKVVAPRVTWQLRVCVFRKKNSCLHKQGPSFCSQVALVCLMKGVPRSLGSGIIGLHPYGEN